MKGRFRMKTKMFKKLIASVLAIATICTCFTFSAFAKTTDGTITIVDPGVHTNTADAISGGKLTAKNLVTWIWEGAKSSDCYYEVKSDPAGEGNPISAYPVLKAEFGEDFWTEENKDKSIVITLGIFPQGGFDYYSLEAQDGYQLTAPSRAVDWQMQGFEYNRFNRVHIVYTPSETVTEDDVTYFPGFKIYENGVENVITNNVWFDANYQYPTEIGVRLSGWNPDAAQTLYLNRFGVYVTDDPMSIIEDYDLISDQTGSTHAWVPEGQTIETETGYLGKAADDVSTHTATTYFADEYTNEVRQTLQMHNQDDSGDDTADWYTGHPDKRYLVFGAQMASNQWTYVGLRADNEWFTPDLAMWDYCKPDQWNQIYIVYDRYSEGAAGANRGTTYFYVNGTMIYEAQRNGSWDKLAKRMDKISLWASNYYSGNPTDVHWDNVEMYMTDTLPDLTETMPSLTANEAQAVSGTGIYEQLSVALDGVATPAELTFDGDKVRVYKGGNVNDMLDSDELISAGDTISVDKGYQVRRYIVTSVTVPAPKLLTNVMAYAPTEGNSAVLSWINPEYTIENTKVYLDDVEQAVEVNAEANAFNEIYFSGLEAGQKYTFKVTTTIGGEAKEYKTTLVAKEARGNSVMGIDTLKSANWMTFACDSNGEYANTEFSIENDDDHGNYVKMTGNMPEVKPNVYAGIGQVITLDNDSSYILKFKAKSEGADSLKLMVSPDSEASYKFSNTTVFNVTDDWEEYSVVVSPEVVAEGTQSQVMLLLYHEIGFVGSVCIDDYEVYYYDAEEGALFDLGNQAVQSDFEPIPAVMKDPAHWFENGMINISIDAENVGSLEVILALYKGNEFYKFTSLKKTNIISDNYQFGASYEGDWATNQYSAKVMYWESFETAIPLRESFVITQ